MKEQKIYELKDAEAYSKDAEKAIYAQVEECEPIADFKLIIADTRIDITPNADTFEIMMGALRECAKETTEDTTEKSSIKEVLDAIFNMSSGSSGVVVVDLTGGKK